MSLAKLRASRAGAVEAGVLVLEGDSYVEFFENGKDKSFFELSGGRVLTTRAIAKAEEAGNITVDWSPVKKDDKGKPVLGADKKPVVLDEIHITVNPGAQMMMTDNGYIGFGVPGQGKSAAELIAAAKA